MGDQPSTTISSRAPRSRTETLLLPKQACSHLHLCPFVLSVRTAGFEPAISWPPTRRDDQASLRSVSVVVSSPYGNRTHLSALKERYPSPIDERAVLCAYTERKWAGRRSNPRLRFFRPPLCHLSYQPHVFRLLHEKRPDVAVTPGLGKASVRCHERKGSYGGRFAPWPNVPAAKQPLPVLRSCIDL